MSTQSMLFRAKAGPPGQALLTNSSGFWQCPANIFTVSVVVIGGGGDGFVFGGNGSGGAGGALAYKNNIAVIPGVSYPYNSGFSSTCSILGVSAGRGQNGSSSLSPSSGGTASGGDANFSGGEGPVGFTSTPGGSAATYTANGSTGGAGQIGAQGIGSSAQYGSGGSKEFSGSAASPTGGAINIIWGAGRSYPSNAANV